MVPLSVVQQKDDEVAPGRSRWIEVVILCLSELFAILAAGWIAKAVLPQDEDNDDEIPYEGIHFFWYILITGVTSCLSVLCGICVIVSVSSSPWFTTVNPWRKRLEAAEEAIVLNAANFARKKDVPFRRSVQFDGCYKNGVETEQCSRGVLEFDLADWHSNAQVYNIRGQGDDEDGAFTIIKGKLSPSGKCFWIQKYKRRGLKVKLVTGLIDNWLEEQGGTTTMRHGYWETRNGQGDIYTRFDLVTANHTGPLPLGSVPVSRGTKLRLDQSSSLSDQTDEEIAAVPPEATAEEEIEIPPSELAEEEIEIPPSELAEEEIEIPPSELKEEEVIGLRSWHWMVYRPQN